MREETNMDIKWEIIPFDMCPEVHPDDKRQCEATRGHVLVGTPHVYTNWKLKQGNMHELIPDPVYWDDKGPIELPEVIECADPECMSMEVIHEMCPDLALLFMLMHYHTAHTGRDPLEMLDETEYMNEVKT